MNYKVLTIVSLLVLPVISGHANDGGDGHVKFNGTVVDAACVVTSESQDQTVQMGQVRNNELIDIGSWANTTPFQIILEDCETNVQKMTAVSFSGNTDANDPQVFKAGFGAGSAKGVGLGIFDFKGELIMPGSEPVRYTNVTGKRTILDYTAKYRKTESSISAGSANAEVWFHVFYQ